MRECLWLLASLIAAPVCGAIYQKIGAWTDRRRYMGSGRLVPVGDGCVYLCEMGTEADPGPTILFESGIGATSQNWLKVQRELATHSRVISYDRAGLGWSTAEVSDATPCALARELQSVLAAAAIQGPYLVVGHSYGGLIARQFAGDYPDSVVGLVLIDPMRPDDWPPMNEARQKPLEQAIRLTAVGRIAAQTGAARLFMRSMLMGPGRVARALCGPGGEQAKKLMDRMLCEVGKMPREVWPSVVANWSRPRFYRTMETYLRAVPQTLSKAYAAPPLDLPVTVLTPVSATPLSEASLRAISSDARQIIASQSAHWIHLDEPELVLATIREMMQKGRVEESASGARSAPAMT